jgi:5-methylcytosine-specific restriction endonuclease McrA
VKPERRERCEACAGLHQTRHHLQPLGLGGSNAASNLIRLCHRCHALTHRLWGPGDHFKGPVERQPLIQALQAHIRESVGH